MADKQVRVGLGVIVKRGNEILLGHRYGSLGEGEWALPGGHLEHGETFEQCATREVEEETGILISDVKFVAAENVIFPTGQHYVVIFMQGIAPQGDADAVLKEPNKCKGWKWVSTEPASWKDMKLFKPLQQLIDHGMNFG